jgi:hypothetical protein
VFQISVRGVNNKENQTKAFHVDISQASGMHDRDWEIRFWLVCEIDGRYQCFMSMIAPGERHEGVLQGSL